MSKDINWLEKEIVYKIDQIKEDYEGAENTGLSIIEGVYRGRMSSLFTVLELVDQVKTTQKPKLPAIPSHVAEWLKKHKEQDLYWILNTLYQHITEIDDWFADNTEKLIDAKRYGYTIKEDKRKDG